jgi:predicted Zn-dependent protease
MAPGTSSTDEMISSTDRGLLVTRFHYINIADPSKAVLTGLTRDGTFLIEKGRVTRPVRNLRFTESMLSAFSAVEALSAERSLEPEFLGAMLVPAAKLSRFRFTGATEF